MEDTSTEEQAAPDTAPPKTGAKDRIFAFFIRGFHTVGHLLPKAGLLAFIVLTPLVITGYPAYVITSKLINYSTAKTVEAKLTGLNFTTITAEGRSSSIFSTKRHIDIVFTFRGEDNKNYVSTQSVSWPAPGLQRKMDDLYAIDDTFTLYDIPNEGIVIDQMVAKDTFLWLTVGMALIFAASALFFLEWKRLFRLKPKIMPPVPVATAKSFTIGQLIALIIATVQAAVIAHTPVTVPIALYLGIYWGIAIFLSLLLRLLVFESPEPLPEPEPEPERGRNRQPSAPPLTTKK